MRNIFKNIPRPFIIPPPNIEKPVPFPMCFNEEMFFLFTSVSFFRHSCLVLEAIYNMLRSLLGPISCFGKHRNVGVFLEVVKDQRDPDVLLVEDKTFKTQ